MTRRLSTHLPPTSRPAVVGEGVANPGVDVVQAQLSLRCSCYRHADQGGVAVGGLTLAVGGGGLRQQGDKVSLLLASVFPTVPPASGSHRPLPAGAQASHSQLRQPVDAGQTGVELRRHSSSLVQDVKFSKT